MNFIASALLCNACVGNYTDFFRQEKNVFELFIIIMERYNLQNCYINEMRGAIEISYSLMRSIKE